MRIYGPHGTAYLNMERRGEPALPACWYYELLRDGKRHTFGTNMLGMVIEYEFWSCTITPYNWRKMREVFSDLGLIKLSGRGLPAVVLYSRPFLPILTGVAEGHWREEPDQLRFWAGDERSPFRSREDIAEQLAAISVRLEDLPQLDFEHSNPTDQLDHDNLSNATGESMEMASDQESRGR